jgi:predicted cation transporter
MSRKNTEIQSLTFQVRIWQWCTVGIGITAAVLGTGLIYFIKIKP